MDKKIKLCYCDITTSTDLTLSATQLRSYIGYKFVQEAEFHHHDGKSYRYPLIQYKRIRDRLSVLGMERFADVVQENLSNLQKIYLKKTLFPNYRQHRHPSMILLMSLPSLLHCGLCGGF